MIDDKTIWLRAFLSLFKFVLINSLLFFLNGLQMFGEKFPFSLRYLFGIVSLPTGNDTLYTVYLDTGLFLTGNGQHFYMVALADLALIIC